MHRTNKKHIATYLSNEMTEKCKSISCIWLLQSWLMKIPEHLMQMLSSQILIVWHGLIRCPRVTDKLLLNLLCYLKACNTDQSGIQPKKNQQLLVVEYWNNEVKLLCRA